MVQLKKWHHPNSTWTEKMIEFVFELRRLGIPYSRIAERINERYGTTYSRNAVIGIATRNMTDDQRALEAARPRVRTQPRSMKPLKTAAEKKLMDAGKREKLRRASEPVASGPMNDFPAFGQCLFIHGDPSSGHWQCCAALQRQASPYCEHHHAVTTTNAKPRMDQTRPLARHLVRLN